MRMKDNVNGFLNTFQPQMEKFMQVHVNEFLRRSYDFDIDIDRDKITDELKIFDENDFRPADAKVLKRLVKRFLSGLFSGVRSESRFILDNGAPRVQVKFVYIDTDMNLSPKNYYEFFQRLIGAIRYMGFGDLLEEDDSALPLHLQVYKEDLRENMKLVEAVYGPLGVNKEYIKQLLAKHEMKLKELDDYFGRTVFAVPGIELQEKARIEFLRGVLNEE